MLNINIQSLIVIAISIILFIALSIIVLTPPKSVSYEPVKTELEYRDARFNQNIDKYIEALKVRAKIFQNQID